jgi:hypothetical protein
MSIPGWQASHGRGSQKGDVIGPLTGQMNPDELSPCTGPARGAAGADDAAWAAWSWAWIWPWMSLRSPSSRCWVS